jgi:hypothetical protein
MVNFFGFHFSFLVNGFGPLLFAPFRRDASAFASLVTDPPRVPIWLKYSLII